MEATAQAAEIKGSAYSDARNLAKEAFEKFPFDSEMAVEFMMTQAKGKKVLIQAFAHTGMVTCYHHAKGIQTKVNKGISGAADKDGDEDGAVVTNDKDRFLPKSGLAGLSRGISGLKGASEAVVLHRIKMEAQIKRMTVPGFTGGFLLDATGLDLDLAVAYESAKMNGHDRNVQFFSRIRGKTNSAQKVKNTWTIAALIELREEIWHETEE